MIKRIICFNNPAYLSIKLMQLVVEIPNKDKQTLPIEDLGVIVLDNPQITLTHNVLVKLLEENVAIITCNSKHHPIGMQLCLDGNTVQSERFKTQIAATEALKKNLWQQTIQRKIYNQAVLLKSELDVDVKNMMYWSKSVLSGDTTNYEGRAAAYYWKNILGIDTFKRERFGDYPNNFFNYTYAILRAIVARGLVSSGLLPTLGIHHKNRYNAYCLADDIMEPYRIYADKLVLDTIKDFPSEEDLNKEIKAKLLQLPLLDVMIDKKQRPLQVAVQETTSSLARCFAAELRKIKYPVFNGKI